MGYYSIYKIIKDIIFTIIKPFKNMSKKTLTIIILFFLVIYLFTFSFSNAQSDPYYSIIENNSTYSKMYNDLTTNRWIYGNIILFRLTNNNYVFIASDINKIKYSFNENNKLTVQALGNFSGTTSIRQFFYLSDGSYYGLEQSVYLSGTQSHSYTDLTPDYYLYSDVVIYNSNNSVVYPLNFYTPPYIINDSISINNWDFDYLNINSGSVSFYYTTSDNSNISQPYLIDLYINYNGIDYTISCDDFIDWDNITNDNFIIKLPRPYISSQFNFVSNSDISFTLVLHKYLSNGEFDEDISYSLGNYTFSLSDNIITNINNDSNKYITGNISNNINNINSSINNNNINDDNISSFSNIDNGMSITDNTGIDTIFQNIYNAFTTKYNDNNIGYGYTLSLPIPFTDKTIDISPHSVFGRDWADLYQPENKYNYPRCTNYI